MESVSATGNRIAWIAGYDTPAVHQHQRSRSPNAAEIHGRRARRFAGKKNALARTDHRKLVEQLFRQGDALALDLVLVDHGDRADGRQVQARDARTGDDDRLCFFVAGRDLFRWLRRFLLCPGGSGQRGDRCRPH